MKNEEDLKIAIYPGSFDPVTKGHLDILERASSMFDRVIIAVLKNNSKKSYLPTKDRVELIRQSINDMDGLKNVDVDSFDGLTIDYARQKIFIFPCVDCVRSRILNMSCRLHRQIESYQMASLILFF